MKSLLFLSLLFALSFAAKLLTVPDPLADSYIVVLNDDATDNHLNLHLNRFNVLSDNSTILSYKYTGVFKGYAAKLSKELLNGVLNDPMVKYVEQDQMMSAIACSTQSSAPSWGIKRVSATAPSSTISNYYYTSTAGKGVTVYIIDTGILINHEDFGTRASFGYKATSSWSDTDANGHGTHVASTTGGTQYGIAKLVNLVAVKVLGDNGSGTNSGVIAGVDWVRNNAKKPASANMSLGGSYSSGLNDAVNSLASSGVPIAVAAGNDNKDASNYSPASASGAICVGSTAEAISGGQDTRSSFSNYGSNLHVFAPGSSITAAYIGSSGKVYQTLSGTSMASPHVCGVAALLLGDGTSAANVRNTIVNNAKSGLVNLNCASGTTCSSSPNKFLHSPC